MNNCYHGDALRKAWREWIKEWSHFPSRGCEGPSISFSCSSTTQWHPLFVFEINYRPFVLSSRSLSVIISLPPVICPAEVICLRLVIIYPLNRLFLLLWSMLLTVNPLIVDGNSIGGAIFRGWESIEDTWHHVASSICLRVSNEEILVFFIPSISPENRLKWINYNKYGQFPITP